MMMMIMIMMWMCKRPAQVPMLCVPIFNMKLAMMQKKSMFTTFSAHTKMAADKRGQDEVLFARTFAFRTTKCWSSSVLNHLQMVGLIQTLK
jgi:hypothetical protein